MAKGRAVDSWEKGGSVVQAHLKTSHCVTTGVVNARYLQKRKRGNDWANWM